MLTKIGGSHEIPSTNLDEILVSHESAQRHVCGTHFVGIITRSHVRIAAPRRQKPVLVLILRGYLKIRGQVRNTIRAIFWCLP